MIRFGVQPKDSLTYFVGIYPAGLINNSKHAISNDNVFLLKQPEENTSDRFTKPL